MKEKFVYGTLVLIGFLMGVGATCLVMTEYDRKNLNQVKAKELTEVDLLAMEMIIYQSEEIVPAIKKTISDLEEQKGGALKEIALECEDVISSLSTALNYSKKSKIYAIAQKLGEAKEYNRLSFYHLTDSNRKLVSVIPKI